MTFTCAQPKRASVCLRHYESSKETEPMKTLYFSEAAAYKLSGTMHIDDQHLFGCPAQKEIRRSEGRHETGTFGADFAADRDM